MLDKIFVYICLLLGIPWSIVVSSLVILFSKISYTFAYKFVRIWAQGWCLLLGISVDMQGLENLCAAPSYILAPNHQSNADILILLTLPVCFSYLSKRQVGYIPFIGQAMMAMRTYWVKRDHSKSDLDVMKRVEQGLINGRLVVIFPEGTRTRTGMLGPFKKGAFRTAINAGVPLCPVAILNSYAIAPAGTLPARWGHRVTLRIGKLFYPDAAAPLAQVMEDFRKVMLGLLEPNIGNDMV